MCILTIGSHIHVLWTDRWCVVWGQVKQLSTSRATPVFGIGPALWVDGLGVPVDWFTQCVAPGLHSGRDIQCALPTLGLWYHGNNRLLVWGGRGQRQSMCHQCCCCHGSLYAYCDGVYDVAMQLHKPQCTKTHVHSTIPVHVCCSYPLPLPKNGGCMALYCECTHVYTITCTCVCVLCARACMYMVCTRGCGHSTSKAVLRFSMQASTASLSSCLASGFLASIQRTRLATYPYMVFSEHSMRDLRLQGGSC